MGDSEFMKNRSSLDKRFTQFKFLSKYERFGLLGILLLMVSVGLLFANISENIYTTCVVAICILTMFFVFRIYLMPVDTDISKIISKTFTMFTTILILILYTIFCISNYSEDLDDMPSGWSTYVKVFMSLLLVQSMVAIYTLYFTNANWIACVIGAVLNIILFVFLIISYTVAKNFRTDGFLV